MTDVSLAVTVQSGARDYYQLPLALFEGNLLAKLVTDLYWPIDRGWFAPINRIASNRVIAARSCQDIDSRRVHIEPKALAAFVAITLTRKGTLHRYKDGALGKAAGEMARTMDAALFCYSPYAYDAFKVQGVPSFRRFVFQLHPHAQSMRDLWLEELERVPTAEASLRHEYELSVNDDEFYKLVEGPKLGSGWVVASSYTAQTLVEQGVPRARIQIVPYGINTDVFTLRKSSPDPMKPLRVIFVGRMVQRKGLSYMFDAVRLLGTRHIQVTLCGRGFVDTTLIAQYSDLDIVVKPGLSTPELVNELHQSDVFVLPSLAEGFAHVILEAMAAGLPVIATDHTCAADVVEEGKHGFVIPIRDTEALAAKIGWALDNRAELAQMGTQASLEARKYTWDRFRGRIRDAYREMVQNEIEMERHA